MDITTLGIDLAKSVFQLHGVDAQGPSVCKRNCDVVLLLSSCLNLNLA